LIQPHVNNLSGKFVSLQDSQDSEQLDVDLNEIVQTICNRYTTTGKSFILRSDRLPHVNANKEALILLFSELISAIINHPPQNSKLFLYITCRGQPQDADVMDLRLAGNFKMYLIDLHTNITSDELWMNLYKNKLEECSVMTQRIGGSFSFFPICNTGCLFSISLPGKIK
jgi:hypothetical protein